MNSVVPALDKNDTPFVCPKCGHTKGKMMFDVTVMTNARHDHHYTKADHQLKESTVWGVDWGNAWVKCEKCHWQRRPIYVSGKDKAQLMYAVKLLRGLYEEYQAVVDATRGLYMFWIDDQEVKELYRDIEKFLDDYKEVIDDD